MSAPLLIAGYWPTTYYPRGQWDPDYWPHFEAPGARSGGARRRQVSTVFRWILDEDEMPQWNDDDEVLVIL